jgi:hypothetical protein
VRHLTRTRFTPAPLTRASPLHLSHALHPCTSHTRFTPAPLTRASPLHLSHALHPCTSHTRFTPTPLTRASPLHLSHALHPCTSHTRFTPARWPSRRRPAGLRARKRWRRMPLACSASLRCPKNSASRRRPRPPAQCFPVPPPCVFPICVFSALFAPHSVATASRLEAARSRHPINVNCNSICFIIWLISPLHQRISRQRWHCLLPGDAPLRRPANEHHV